MSKIKNIIAREILDSRGNPTVEADVILECGIIGTASVPSGASTGSKEALELRDKEERFLGKGVLKAINNICTKIRPSLIGLSSLDQEKIDNTMIELDGTGNKSKLGANAILAVSLANMKAAAKFSNKEFFEYIGEGKLLPTPMMNIINGGSHADNNLDFQEFMIIPQSDSFKERIRIGVEIFHTLKGVLKEKGYNTSVGDEGGFAPNLKSNEEALELINEASKKAGYEPGRDVFYALDSAANEFFEDGSYVLKEENKKLSSSELTDMYIELVNKYPIISIEDGHDEKDIDGWKDMTSRLGEKIQIVGDDLFVTNKQIFAEGIDNGIANAILIKANQIGTVTEMIETIKMAEANGYKTVISHRSGETEDTFIADFAVGLNLGQIKTGSLSRTDRVCKYNRLLKIDEKIKTI